jgi:hypothetical protein
MIKLVAAAALTAFLIYDATMAPGITGGLETQPTRELKGDRLPILPLGSTCSEAAWPYQGDCLRIRAKPDGAAVRVVTTDCLPDVNSTRWLTS